MTVFRRYLKRIFAANREFILSETVAANGVMQVLMKFRDRQGQWTMDEMRQLRHHFVRLSLVIPAFLVFLLPLGSVILPVLAEMLDRRSKPRL